MNDLCTCGHDVTDHGNGPVGCIHCDCEAFHPLAEEGVVNDDDSLIERRVFAAVFRFAEDADFRNRVELAADMTRRMVELVGLTTCDQNHTLDYRRAAAIALLLAEEDA